MWKFIQIRFESNFHFWRTKCVWRLFGKSVRGFEKWLDENASEYLTEDEMKDLKEKINAMTADVDSLNAQEGYRGTSYESVFC